LSKEAHVTTPDPTSVADRVTPRWQDPTLPTADRVELLLEQMTLEEKVAQLGSRWIGGSLPDAEADSGQGPAADRDGGLAVAPMQDVFAAGRALSLEEASRHGLGHLTRVFGSAPVTAAEGAAELVRQQRVVLDASRLRIPALAHEECLTGFTTFGATVYPAAIAWGATFDPALVERMAAAIGRDMAAVGGSRRPWAKTPTSSRCSAPPTCGACRAPASSPP
jgi:Glycosyl hydrolase family 3 N terminal domain